MCGLPFAGKSTAARELQCHTQAPLVRLDAINAERGVGLDGAPIPPHAWEQTYAEAYRRVASALAAGESVIFDHGNFSRVEREHVRALAHRAGAPVRFVYVPVTPEEARRRWLQNRQTHARYDIRDDDFEHALRLFQSPEDEPDVVSLETLWRDFGC